MDLEKRIKEGPLLGLQRLIKIIFFRTEELIGKARAELARQRHQGKLVLREVQGSRMYLDTSDKGICADLYARGIREDSATGELQKRLRPGMVVVDIGANIGYYALIEARVVGQEGKIYAIEPIAENVALLKRNIKANAYRNIEVFENAIGDKSCEKEIFLSNKSNLSTFCNNKGLDMTGKKRKVKVLTLDKFLKGKKSPQLVRMDIEGYEFEVLQGMKQTMKSSKDLQMFIEVHAEFLGKEKTRKLLEMLKANGFNKCRVLSDLPASLKVVGKLLSKKVVPENFDFSGSIDSLVEEERFHNGLYHLFTEKSGGF